jgi:hypothetical protein
VIYTTFGSGGDYFGRFAYFHQSLGNARTLLKISNAPILFFRPAKRDVSVFIA